MTDTVSLGGCAPSPIHHRGKHSIRHEDGPWPLLRPLHFPSLAGGSGSGRAYPSVARAEHGRCRFPWRPRSIFLPLPGEAAAASHPRGRRRTRDSYRFTRPPRSPASFAAGSAAASCILPSRGRAAAAAASLGRRPPFPVRRRGRQQRPRVAAQFPFPRRGKRQWPRVPLRRAGQARPLPLPLAGELHFPYAARGGGGGLASSSVMWTEEDARLLRFPWRPRFHPPFL